MMRGRGKIDVMARWPRRLAAVVSSPLLYRVGGDVRAALARGDCETAFRIARIVGRPADLEAEKIVSRKYRCLWLCVPKAASRTIRQVLLQADPRAAIVYGSVSDAYAKHPEARDYCSFAFVRHPYTRALSFHAEIHRAHEHGTDVSFTGEKEKKRRRLFGRHPGLGETTDFEDYCRWLHTPYGADAGGNRHFLSQHLQIRSDDGRLPDFIGRFESLDADLRRLAARLGMPPPAPPSLNTMVGHDPRPEALAAARGRAARRLTERSRTLLRERYAEDFNLLGFPARRVGSGRPSPSSADGRTARGGNPRCIRAAMRPA